MGIAIAILLLIVVNAVVVTIMIEKVKRQDETRTRDIAKLTEQYESGVARDAVLLDYATTLEESLAVTDALVYATAIVVRESDRRRYEHTDTDNNGETTAYPHHTTGSTYPDPDADNSTVPLPDEPDNWTDGCVGGDRSSVPGGIGAAGELHNGLLEVDYERILFGSPEHADSFDDMDNVYGDDGRPYEPEGV